MAKQFRAERLQDGVWEPYTAWSDDKARVARWVHRQNTEWDVNNSYRMVERDAE